MCKSIDPQTNPVRHREALAAVEPSLVLGAAGAAGTAGAAGEAAYVAAGRVSQVLK